jgi:putative tricarboxylic transport membrane protein
MMGAGPGRAREGTRQLRDEGGANRRWAMTTYARGGLGILVAVGLALAMTGPGLAAGFPEKPITLVVHAGAGGGSDIFSRTLSAANDKEKFLPQPIVVENKPGGSGAIAFAYVGSKRKDPYFLLTAVTSFLTTPILRKSQIDYTDFTPIANFAFDEYIIIVRADGKYKSIKDVVDAAKANPKRVTVGGTQLGSSDSICAYLLEKSAGVQFNYIVFNSGGEVNAALMGGHIDWAVSNPGEALELAKAKKVLTLGVFAEKRLAGAPDVPTLKEQGYDATYVQNRGLVAPAGIPDEARKVYEGAFQKYIQSEIWRNYLKENLLSEAWMDGPTFGKWLDKEHARYQSMLKDMGLLK